MLEPATVAGGISKSRWGQLVRWLHLVNSNVAVIAVQEAVLTEAGRGAYQG